MRDLAKARRDWRARNPENLERDRQNMRDWIKANPLNYMLSTARRRAKVAGLEFTITKADFPTLPTHCPVLGIELQYGGGQGKRTDASASLDRKDCARGYVPGNVEIMSWRANNLKADATLEELRRLVAYLEG